MTLIRYVLIIFFQDPQIIRCCPMIVSKFYVNSFYKKLL